MISYRNMIITEISESGHINDLIIYAQNGIEWRWKAELPKRNLKINVDMTKIMIMDKNEGMIILKIDNRQIEQIESEVIEERMH